MSDVVSTHKCALCKKSCEQDNVGFGEFVPSRIYESAVSDSENCIAITGQLARRLDRLVTSLDGKVDRLGRTLRFLLRQKPWHSWRPWKIKSSNFGADTHGACCHGYNRGYREAAYLRQSGTNKRFFCSSSSFEGAGRLAYLHWAWINVARKLPLPSRFHVPPKIRKDWINQTMATISLVIPSVGPCLDCVRAKTVLCVRWLNHLPTVPCSSRFFLRLLRVG